MIRRIRAVISAGGWPGRTWRPINSSPLRRAREIVLLFGHDPTYSYNSACLRSRQGDQDQAMTLLRRSLRQGWTDVAAARSDPQLAPLRTSRNREFNELTTVSTRWNIDFGLMLDDITLVNDSEFALTNVVFELTLMQDATKYELRLEAPRVAPGESYKWSNVVSVTGNRLTGSSSNVKCDQNRSLVFVFAKRI